jgi:hypothetical protein
VERSLPLGGIGPGQSEGLGVGENGRQVRPLQRRAGRSSDVCALPGPDDKPSLGEGGASPQGASILRWALCVSYVRWATKSLYRVHKKPLSIRSGPCEILPCRLASTTAASSAACAISRLSRRAS